MHHMIHIQRDKVSQPILKHLALQLNHLQSRQKSLAKLKIRKSLRNLRRSKKVLQRKVVMIQMTPIHPHQKNHQRKRTAKRNQRKTRKRPALI